jgi:electron-transferring-flavoprotein dehydrogenase
VARAPSDFPPPFDARDVVVAPSAAADDQLEVGIAIVGGGPAGLACAIRLGQLLADDPATAEALGEVPVAVIDKGRVIGAHQLSGAVVDPRVLRELFPEVPLEQMTGYGEVRRESVYFLSSKRAQRIPTPPPFHNKGNWVFSLSRLTRWLADQAEQLGAMPLPETDVQKLLVRDGSVVGVRTGDKGRGRDGEPLGSFEPGAELVARATVLAEGVQGMLAGAAFDHFGVAGDNPQIYALGVKEIWKVPRALDRVIHTLGWPLRARARFHEFGGSFVYPMGEDTVTVGFVAGLDATDATLSVHDLLQELKLHPLVRRILEGGERIGWGAKAIPEGGFWSLPQQVALPGTVVLGDAAGFVNVPRLKGVHYAMRSGVLAAESIHTALREGRDLQEPGALDLYQLQVRNSEIWHDLERVRNMRQAMQRGLVVGGALAGLMDVSRGRVPGGRFHAEPDAAHPVFVGDRSTRYPAADGSYTFDKLSSVFASGNRSRDDQPDHIRIQHRVPLEVATAWAWTCPAQVYEVGEQGPDGLVELAVTPSNCVQCGAITAKGGRLTPPEGGGGPEYTLT